MWAIALNKYFAEQKNTLREYLFGSFQIQDNKDQLLNSKQEFDFNLIIHIPLKLRCILELVENVCL